MSEPVWPEGYTAVEVERFDDEVLKGLVARNLTRGSGFMEVERGHPPELQARLKAQQEARRLPAFGLRLEVQYGGEVVAWSYSRGEGERTLRMMTSGVEQAHRRRGLYTAMLRHVTERARTLGFEDLRSNHAAANNPILIAKLREGWVITGTELNLGIGLLVSMQRYLHPAQQAAFNFRSGWRGPSPEVLALYGKD